MPPFYHIVLLTVTQCHQTASVLELMDKKQKIEAETEKKISYTWWQEEMF